MVFFRYYISHKDESQNVSMSQMVKVPGDFDIDLDRAITILQFEDMIEMTGDGNMYLIQGTHHFLM